VATPFQPRSQATVKQRHKPASRSDSPKSLDHQHAAMAGPELLRRVLLGAVTALVVARPLVLGEDPGLLLRPWSDAWGLVLTLLWFVTALAGAVWHVWSGQRTWNGGLVAAALLAVAGLVFASAAWSAAYKQPAWLIAWEWLALFLAFCLVRNL